MHSCRNRKGKLVRKNRNGALSEGLYGTCLELRTFLPRMAVNVLQPTFEIRVQLGAKTEDLQSLPSKVYRTRDRIAGKDISLGVVALLTSRPVASRDACRERS